MQRGSRYRGGADADGGNFAGKGKGGREGRRREGRRRRGGRGGEGEEGGDEQQELELHVSFPVYLSSDATATMSNVVIPSPEVLLQAYEEASQLWYNTITEHEHWSVPKLRLVGKKGKPDGWCRARRHRLEGIMEDLMQNGKLPSDVDMQFCRRNLCKQAEEASHTRVHWAKVGKKVLALPCYVPSAWACADD